MVKEAKHSERIALEMQSYWIKWENKREKMANATF